jgi:hypothetical protein
MKTTPALEHPKALKAQLSVGFPVVIHRDHGKVENGFKLRQVNAVLREVCPSFRFVPADHEDKM